MRTGAVSSSVSLRFGRSTSSILCSRANNTSSIKDLSICRLWRFGQWVLQSPPSLQRTVSPVLVHLFPSFHDRLRPDRASQTRIVRFFAFRYPQFLSELLTF